MAEYHVVPSGDRWHVQRRGDGTLIGHKAGSVVSTHDTESAAVEWAKRKADPEEPILVRGKNGVETIEP